MTPLPKQSGCSYIQPSLIMNHQHHTPHPHYVHQQRELQHRHQQKDLSSSKTQSSTLQSCAATMSKGVAGGHNVHKSSVSSCADLVDDASSSHQHPQHHPKHQRLCLDQHNEHTHDAPHLKRDCSASTAITALSSISSSSSRHGRIDFTLPDASRQDSLGAQHTQQSEEKLSNPNTCSTPTATAPLNADTEASCQAYVDLLSSKSFAVTLELLMKSVQLKSYQRRLFQKRQSQQTTTKFSINYFHELFYKGQVIWRLTTTCEGSWHGLSGQSSNVVLGTDGYLAIRVCSKRAVSNNPGLCARRNDTYRLNVFDLLRSSAESYRLNSGGRTTLSTMRNNASSDERPPMSMPPSSVWNDGGARTSQSQRLSLPKSPKSAQSIWRKGTQCLSSPELATKMSVAQHVKTTRNQEWPMFLKNFVALADDEGELHYIE